MKSILVFDNNFFGAYGSLKCFIQEIVCALKKLNQNVLLVSTVSEAVNLYNNGNIDFSIGIGKYLFFLDGQPLYELYKKRHYQWVIDNSLKVQIDTQSHYIKYILIDRMFQYCMGKTKNSFLYLPLGIPEFKIENTLDKDYGIVFSGQIRDSNKIFDDILMSTKRREITELLDRFTSNLDLSYIPELMRNIENFSLDERVMIFSLTNSFLRAYKREKVLSSIKNIPVSIIGENRSRVISNNKNIKILGKASYYDTVKIMARYMFNINIEPNFNCGFHDRILRSVTSGSIIITNYGQIQQQILKNDVIFYDYANLDMIESKVRNMHKNEMFEMRNRLAKKISSCFVWEKILEIVICDFRRIKQNANNRLFRILGN